MSFYLPPLCLDYFLAEISDISKVQQFISMSHEVAQQVVLITQELILAEVINAEIIDSDIIHAIELIVSQASSVGSPSSSPGGFSFGSFHQLLDCLKTGHTQSCEHERISCALIHLLHSNPTAYRHSTAGHHIAPASEPHGVGDCYGCSCPSQGTGNMFSCEVTHQGFTSGPGHVDVFGIGS